MSVFVMGTASLNFRAKFGSLFANQGRFLGQAHLNPL